MIAPRRFPAVWALPLVASILLACPAAAPDPSAKTQAEPKPDAVKTDATAKPDEQPAKPDTAQADKNKAEARAKFEDHDAAAVDAGRTQMVATLNAGRKLVKEGKLDEGMVKYKELLALDPHYGPALGELGWAEFQAGDYSSAHAHTLRALARAPDDNRRGMLHYNLGRIAEDRSQTEVAIEAYALSLALRPNEVVADRLELLTHVESAEGFVFTHPAVEAYKAAHAAGVARKPTLLPVLARGAKTIADACEIALDREQDDSSTCELVAQPGADASWGVLAVDFYGIERYWYPAIQVDEGWVVFSTALVGQVGSEVDQSVDAISGRVVTNEVGSFLFIDYSDHLYERDWSWGELEELEEIPDDDAYETEGVIICKRGPTLMCTGLIPTRWDYRYGSGIHNHYESSVTMKGDTIVIADVITSGDVTYGVQENVWDPVSPIPAGEYAFADLK